MTWAEYVLIMSRTCSSAAIKEGAFAIYDWFLTDVPPETAAQWATARFSKTNGQAPAFSA